MSFAALVRRNLLYHWRGNLAVLLGVALGSAVLTGALLVGDSLRGSLRDLSGSQLGWVEEVLAPGRFFSLNLADLFPTAREENVTGIILLNASASQAQGNDDSAVSAQLFGVGGDFWDKSASDRSPIPDNAVNWGSTEGFVDINGPLAQQLGAKVGDTLHFNVQKRDNIPRETLLGKRKADDVLDSVSVKVRRILSNEGMANFSVRPTPEPVRNAFVPLRFLQKRLGLAESVNVALMGGSESKGTKSGSSFPLDRLTLRDWGLKLLTPDDRARALVRFLDPRNSTGELRRLKWQGRVPDDLAKLANADGVLTLKSIETFYREKRRYLLLQSDQLYLDATTEAALEKAFDLKDTKYRPTLIYLADRLASGGAEEPYATVAAVLPTQVPGFPNDSLADGDIRLVAWPGSPLKPKVGDPVELDYYFPGDRNQLVLKKATFIDRGSVPLIGDADDPDWTPEYPGLTDKLDIAGWENPPFPPFSTRKLMERIKPADEEFWKRYRATPKAYITLAAGQKLFATRFGKLTALRIDLPADVDPNVAAAEFDTRLRKFLDPERGGFVVQDVRGQALKASSGSSDFGGLFLGFSFFLIVSALLLVGLLVRLNLERRAHEIGLLAATGWSPRLIGRLLRLEGWVLIGLGSALGLVAARGFAGMMLKLLAVKWPGQGTLQFLTLHETPLSYAIGFAASASVSALTLRWAFRMLRRLTPRQLLTGDLAPSPPAPFPQGERGTHRRMSSVVLAVFLVGAAAALVCAPFVSNHEAQAGAFFGGGVFALTALLTLIWRWLNSQPVDDPQPTLVRLGIRNAGRNPTRSLLTIGLLAAATFLIVAIQAFHREPAVDFFNDNAGSGGFRLFAQTDVPLYQSLADRTVQAELGMKDSVLAQIQDVQSFRLQPGDDASCLNLYKPLSPRILGVPETLIREGRFAFAGSLGTTDAQKANPWTLLDEPQADGSIPAIVDANSAQWILKVSLGGLLSVKNQNGEEVMLRIVGLLKESLFQSEVLVSDASFLKLYPSQQGYQFFLIRCDEAHQAEVLRGLQSALATQGGQVRPTFDRLASYLAVENTYLATFQALGGLGLLLGAIGLAIVLVRGIWERRAEFALLRAVGFQGRQLAVMVLAENGLLLFLGLGVGCLAALVAIAPHLIGGDAKLVWGQIALLLAGVSAVGAAAGSFAVARSLRTPVLTALRRE